MSPDGRLFALDARTGRSRPEFGKGGVVDLRVGVADGWPNAYFEASSPPAIYRDLLITGSHLQEYPARGPGRRRPRLRRPQRRAGVAVPTPCPGRASAATTRGRAKAGRTGRA